MADEATVTSEVRTLTGSANARRLRRQGLIPAVLYGHGEECIQLSLPARQVEAVLRHGGHVVDLQIEDQTQKALIKDVQHDALADTVLHMDLTRVSADERVQVQLSIELRGTPAGEGFQLQHLLHEVQVECLALEIPEGLQVRITDMKVGDALHVKDLDVPAGLQVLADPDEVVVQLTEALEIEEPEPEEVETGAAEPEVIGGRREDEGEGEEPEGE